MFELFDTFESLFSVVPIVFVVLFVILISLAVIAIVAVVVIWQNRKQAENRIQEILDCKRYFYLLDEENYLGAMMLKEQTGQWPEADIPANAQLISLLERAGEKEGKYPDFQKAVALYETWRAAVVKQYGSETAEQVFSMLSPEDLEELRGLLKSKSASTHFLAALMSGDSGVTLFALLHGKEEQNRIDEMDIRGRYGKIPNTQAQQDFQFQQVLRFQQDFLRQQAMEQNQRAVQETIHVNNTIA